jgi:hypothetical protein
MLEEEEPGAGGHRESCCWLGRGSPRGRSAGIQPQLILERQENLGETHTCVQELVSVRMSLQWPGRGWSQKMGKQEGWSLEHKE